MKPTLHFDRVLEPYGGCQGYSELEQFAMVINMSVMNKSTFNDHAAVMKKASEYDADSVLHDPRLEVRKAYSDLIVDAAVPEISDISVSFDGTWLTRGHSSMYGVGSVHDRQEMRAHPDFRVWYAVHAPECDINHEGSSGAMEAEAALILWKRSEQYGLRYTTILSDGDASTYKRISDEKPYGASVAIKKEECINHIGKRLGTALRKAVSEWRTRGCKLGGRGHSTLKAMTIAKLQKYYQKAILDNQSWCFYQRAVAQGKQPGPHEDNVGTPLKEAVLAKMMPVYQRLASNTLLERCLKCLTQNANESLHSVIWRHCPKDSFGSKRRVDLAVDLAVCKFNAGCTKTVLSLQEAAGLPTGNKTVALGVRRDRGRVVKAKLRATKKVQHYRQAIKSAKRRLLEAAKRTEGTTYKAGHF
ncbi:hypothetical protein ANN_15937 [Periplaneta americana]|uniref:Mutator-like transposase domain-containing protein n=1 Tax=Periplaneta americana TaxID=6978 RepID=A0ABQ8SIY8_PERAM|nr:hypothetical protein ANN_15937 [Periplaneta americana]